VVYYHLGLKKGDTAVIYMPMIPQAAFAMLACARIGVTHSVVFGGFAPHELAIRIDDCKPRVIITASSGIEIDRLIAYKPLVDEAIELADHKPKKVVVFNRKLGARVPFKKYDVDYDALVYGSEEVALCSCKFDPSIICFIYFRNNRKTKRNCQRYRWLCYCS
jgi:propionyl-CoA synthetase